MTNETKMSVMPFGAYEIDKDYIRSLMKDDEDVIDPDVTNIYIGPAYIKPTENGEDCYFVPVDLSYKDFSHWDDKHFMSRLSGTKLKHWSSIVCNDTALITPYDSDERLNQLCKEHPEWIKGKDWEWERFSSPEMKKIRSENSKDPVNIFHRQSNIADADGELFRKIQDHLFPEGLPYSNSMHVWTSSSAAIDIKFGVYRVDKEYIRELRSYDENIVDPDDHNRYVGPIFHAETKRGPMEFFVPAKLAVIPDCVSPDVEKFSHTENFNGIYADVMDFRRMIPIPKQNLECNDPNRKFSQFCIDNRKFIEACGMIMLEKKEWLEDWD